MTAEHLTSQNTVEVDDRITDNVRQMYTRHPFPPPQRRNTYKQHAAYVRGVLRELGIEPGGKRFGDIACGTGLMLLDYAKEFPEASFQGYDLSPVSVERACATLAEEGITNASAVVQDIMRLDDQEEFDYILSWGTIHHLSDSREGVRRLCRALKRGGVLRTGIYGYYGNWERRLQQELVDTIVSDKLDFQERIQVVRDWASGDANFSNHYTEPPVDLDDDDWVVDEFLHVWERHLRLREVVQWLEEDGMRVLRLTDYWDNEIPLDIAAHSTNAAFVERVRRLPLAEQCHLIDMIARPYWLSVIAQKA